MGYALVEVDVATGAARPEIRLRDDQDGIAVVARDRGRVVGFAIEPRPAGSVVGPAALLAMLGARGVPASVRDDPPPGPAGSTVSITVAVCTRDRTERLGRCLDSIVVARDPDTKVLVVDNAPSDSRTERLVASRDDVTYTCEPRPGLDIARNRALHEAGTDVVAFVDDDVVVDRDFVHALQRAWSRDADAAAVTGLILPSALDTDAQVTFERSGGFREGFTRLRYDGAHDPADPLHPWGPKFGSGANMALRRDVALALGGFDDALDTGPPLPGGGDLDMLTRLLRDGRVLVYDPAVVVFHEHRRTMRELRRQYWSWGESYLAFLSKWWWTDPDARPALRRVLRWWLAYEVAALRDAGRGDGARPPALAAAELAGGLVGLAGSYQRSARRIARTRACR